MTDLQNILKHFYVKTETENKFPRFGKFGRQNYLFTCKICGSTSEPMHFDHNMKYRLGVHLTKMCHKLSNSDNSRNNQLDQQQQQEEA